MFSPDKEQSENKIEEKKISSFETARGSVYTYLPDGKVQRFKKATNETFVQDVVAFIPDWDWILKHAPEKFIKEMESRGEFEQRMLEYIQRNEQGELRAWIIDEAGIKLDTMESLNKSEKTFLYFGTYEKSDFIIPVSKDPKLNYLPFDTIKYKEGEGYKRQSHIGNRVVKINYE